MAYYLNKKTWTLNSTPPGIRIPTVAAIPVATMLGGALVVFLPIIGFAMLGWAIWKRLTLPSIPADSVLVCR